jgi:hypothetical protein
LEINEHLIRAGNGLRYEKGEVGAAAAGRHAAFAVGLFNRQEDKGFSEQRPSLDKFL